MFSRAHLLIDKEIQKLKMSPPWGVQIEPVSDENVFEWIAKVKGLKDTAWEGGIFQICIKFDEHFNVRPPQIVFQTIPFHPNVDMKTGRPCIPFLDDFNLWHPSYSLNMILVTVQTILSNPSMDNAVNLEAADMMQQTPPTYQQVVMECVATSQAIDAGNTIPEHQDSKVRAATKQESGRWQSTAAHTASARVTKLSFHDYHLTWQSIATTKSRQNAENQLHGLLEKNPQLQKVHLGLTKEALEEQKRRQNEEYHQLVYGSFKGKLNVAEERDARLARIQQMKKIYLPTQASLLSPEMMVQHLTTPVISQREAADEWEKEVDDLVIWTDKLDANVIDT